mgnify:CR=1 FL=1|jgi:putative transposase
MLRAIKIRLYPNKAQEQELNKVLGCYRFVYNQMLALKQKEYDENKKSLGLTELSKYFHGTLLKDEQYAWLKEQNTKVMKQAMRQMLSAYDKFFKQHNGFPNFKTKKDKQSALFPYEAISKKNTFETKHISLITSLKDIKFRCSDLYFRRLQKYNKDIRSATLSKTKSGKFFLSILVEMDDTELKRFGHTNKQVGIDLGVKDFVITSDGEVFENKHFFKKREKQVKKLQRQISRKVKGSNNRRKTKIRIARLFERITNKKVAYIHYVTNELLTYFDTIFMEDLNVKGMLKNHHLAKAIQEVGFYKFKEVFINKALVNDKKVVFIDRFYPSSKTCSGCGYKKRDLKLSDRFWVCPECGSEHDRDINAARNILLEGQRMLAAV